MSLMKWFPNSFDRWWKVIVSILLLGLSSCQQRNFAIPSTQNLKSGLNTQSAEEYSHFSYDGQYLVFASDRRGKRGIWLYDFRGRRLLPLPGLNQPGSRQDQPDISSDGRYIVYVSEQEGKPEIFVYDRQIFKPEKITKNWLREVRNPSISGNGRFISFELNRGGQWDIVIYDWVSNISLSFPNQLFKNNRQTPK